MQMIIFIFRENKATSMKSDKIKSKRSTNSYNFCRITQTPHNSLPETTLVLGESKPSLGKVTSPAIHH
ncbi:hypothetical protein Hanom_Chr08g00715181 [Helianthus anomalus]